MPGVLRTRGDIAHRPGITLLDEHGDEIPLPEVTIDEPTLLRARAERLLRQRQGAAATEDVELLAAKEAGDSCVLVSELRRVHERWVKPAERILDEPSLDASERTRLQNALEEAVSTAAAWPAMATQYATLAQHSPALCMAFDRSDLLHRILLEILRSSFEPAPAR